MAIKVTKVQYTVNEGYVEENKKRIGAVMEELRALGKSDVVRYSSSLLEDGKSFMHLLFRKGEGANDLPGSLASFKKFQEGLKQNLEVPPKVENFELVDSNYDLF